VLPSASTDVEEEDLMELTEPPCPERDNRRQTEKSAQVVYGLTLA